MTAATEFSAMNLCVLTVSDTRTRENDTSGDYLAQALADAGHRLHDRAIAKDDVYRLRALSPPGSRSRRSTAS
jgi:molybdenum cofactor biosynthesis protein B